MNELEDRLKVVEIAKSFLNTPYHHMGRVKGAGVDCLTLLACVYEEAGLVDKVEIPYYPKDWHMHRSEERYLNGLLKYAREVSTPLPGDIVLWKFGRCFSHGAIIVKWPIVIHAYSGIGCVYQDTLASDFLRSIDSHIPTKPGQRVERARKFFSFW